MTGNGSESVDAAAADFEKRTTAIEQRWREIGDANGWPKALQVELEHLVTDTVALMIEASLAGNVDNLAVAIAGKLIAGGLRG